MAKLQFEQPYQQEGSQLGRSQQETSHLGRGQQEGRVQQEEEYPSRARNAANANVDTVDSSSYTSEDGETVRPVAATARYSITLERLKAGPFRGVSARKMDGPGQDYPDTPGPGRRFPAWSEGVIVQKRKKFHVFFCISGHSEHFSFLGEKS